MINRIVILLTFATALIGCSDNSQSQAPVIPEFNEARLVEGRSVWINTCRNCHLMGVAGAPAINDAAAWAPRRQNGKGTLYTHAIQGIQQNGTWTMPPRGGNDALSDGQIQSAVDYMLAAVDKLSTNN